MNWNDFDSHAKLCSVKVFKMMKTKFLKSIDVFIEIDCIYIYPYKIDFIKLLSKFKCRRLILHSQLIKMTKRMDESPSIIDIIIKLSKISIKFHSSSTIICEDHGAFTNMK